MAEVNVLYMHGLGATNLRRDERRLLERNKNKGYNFTPAFIDWTSKEGFENLLARMIDQANEMLEDSSKDSLLLLEGSSAGGSLAFNVAAQLQSPRVRTISHSGRLATRSYARWDPRSLEKCAHLGTDRASQMFYDSVKYFEEVTLPGLSEEQIGRMLITKPWADEVVPVSTMVVSGIQTATMPIAGHSLGIGFGIMRIPSLMQT